MAFLNESGLQRFWENIVSKFVRKVDGKDLSSNDYTDEEKEKLAGLENYTDATTSAAGLMSSADKTYIESLKEDRLGTFAGKTIAELQAALETWLESNLVVNATTYVAVTENSLVDGWNSKDTSSMLSDGPRWFFTVMAAYSNTDYVNLRISSYNSQNVYSVIRQNGTWRSILKLAYVNDINVKDTDITWSDTNLVEKVSLIDFASSNLHNANRFAFANVEGIKVEHSTDGGATYFESTIANYPERKIKLVSGLIDGSGGNFRIGDPTGATPRASIQDKLRVTFNAPSMGIYTSLKKLLLNVSTNGAGGCKVTLETSIANTPDVYTTRGTYVVQGWTGWNSIPVDFRFGSSTNIGNIRLTFGIESLSSNESFNCYLTLCNVIALGETAWSIPSTMGKTGHLYSYDYQQNATFPANVTATKFVGNGSGLTNLDATKLTGVVPAANLPSYVDDVIEVANYNALPLTGETGKIYIDLATNKTYRWSGSTYIEIGSNGEVSFQDSVFSNERAGEIGTLTINGTNHTLYSPIPWDVGATGNYTSTDILPVFFSGSVLPETSLESAFMAGEEPQGLAQVNYHSSVGIKPSTGVLFGAAWNDYAEYRKFDGDNPEAGRVVTETGKDSVQYSIDRLGFAPSIISDTYGMVIGDRGEGNVPLAIGGKVLAYPYESRNTFKVGDAVCSGPNGTVSKMTRREIVEWPDRILGYYVGTPEEEEFNGNPINGRIWIRIR